MPNDPSTRRRGKTNRQLQVTETFSDEFPNVEAFWEAHPRALQLFGQMLAKAVRARRNEDNNHLNTVGNTHSPERMEGDELTTAD